MYVSSNLFLLLNNDNTLELLSFTYYLDNNCTFNFEDVFPSLISNTFNGFSKSFVNNIINKLKTQNKLSIVNLSNNIKDYEHIIFLVFST